MENQNQNLLLNLLIQAMLIDNKQGRTKQFEVLTMSDHLIVLCNN